MQELLILAALSFAAQPRLSADGRTLVYVEGEMLVRRLLPSGDETAVRIPGLVGAPLASGDGSRALVQSSQGRLSVDLQTGAAVELPDGLEPVSAGGVDVFRTRLGPLQAGETLLEPGFHSAASDPYRKLALLASDTELAVWDARKRRIAARKAAKDVRILGPGLIAAPGWTVESVELPSLERKVLWRGPYAPSSYALAPDALYLVTERPRTLRKAYPGGAEAWALPWTEQPVALLGFSGGKLYLSDGQTVEAVAPEPAALGLYKEQAQAPAPGPGPSWLLIAALAVAAGLLLFTYRRR